MTENYWGAFRFLEARYAEVGGYEFYRDLFPGNERSGDHEGPSGGWVPNAIYLYRDKETTRRGRAFSRRIMLDNTWGDDYMAYVERQGPALCGGLSYRGRANTLANAARMHALVFDLDGVGLFEIGVLFDLFSREKGDYYALPVPTYVALSGAGVHLYYVFGSPVALYPNIKTQMKRLKYELTAQMWLHGSTTQVESVQYQSVNQGFRMVGSVNERYGTAVRAFRVGGRVTLDCLNGYVGEAFRVDEVLSFRPSRMTLGQAAARYPRWHERVVVRGERSLGRWDIGGQKGHQGDELYNWWLRRATDRGLKGGHRYFFLVCMAIYATKCGLPKERLEADMWEVFEILRRVGHTNELTRDDVRAALGMHGRDCHLFGIEDIERMSGLRIERNKRNGRTREEHLRRARAVQLVDYPNYEWAGRPSARLRVEAYRRERPDARKADCVRETGLSKKTVYRWWDAEPAGP